jgi:hypothetical protein
MEQHSNKGIEDSVGLQMTELFADSATDGDI